MALYVLHGVFKLMEYCAADFLAVVDKIGVDLHRCAGHLTKHFIRQFRCHLYGVVFQLRVGFVEIFMLKHIAQLVRRVYVAGGLLLG